MFGILRRLRPRRRSTRLPPGVRLYCVGDIHGRSDLLLRMLELIRADVAAAPPASALTVFLGDYVDRGPDSRGVLDLLTGGALPTAPLFLLGNHELMLRQFLHEPATFETWQHDGGLETLLSYGIRPVGEPVALAALLREAMPADHLELLAAGRTSFSMGDYFFCHAGVRPGVPLDRQSPDDLLWIRREFLSSDKDFGKIVVHGHSPTSEPEVRHNRIGLDTGAYISGRLTCLALEGTERRFLFASRS